MYVWVFSLSKMRFYTIELELVQVSRRWHKSMIIPNQNKFGLEFSRRWRWSRHQIFQTNLNLVWNLRLTKSNFSFKPNWNWFGKGCWMKCSLTTHSHLTCYKGDIKRLWILIFFWRRKKVYNPSRDEICQCRRCQQQCKIFASGVSFSRNNAIYNINESTTYILSWFHI